MIHALKPNDQVARTNFALDMLERIDPSPDFLLQVCFSDEAAFHGNGILNSYAQLQDLGQSKSMCYMWIVERQPQSIFVGRLNARQVD
jgi:hypothetical protein